MIQGFKRSPINLRPLFGIRHSPNPKGIGLFASSLIRLARVGLASETEARGLADRLEGLRSPGWKHACWGYNFDWQTRTYLVPKFHPNIICTTFVSETLLDAFDRWQDERYLDLAIGGGRFLLDDLKRTELGDSFCFSYTPLRPSRVHNANLLGAALLARLWSHTRNDEFREAAEAATRYGIRHQQSDGSWIYGEDPHQEWIDSFHTGYNLIALRAVARNLEMKAADISLREGYRYYRQAFFPGGGLVKYFHNRLHPIDVHAVAHAILALVQLSDLDETAEGLAAEIAHWAEQHLQSAEGYFYYQQTRRMTNRIPYMRWGQAWMLRGLSELLVAQSGRRAEPQRHRGC